MTLADYRGTIPVMAEEVPPNRQAELLRRIDERLTAMKLSERKASLNAKAGADFIRDIRRRGHSPKADKLARLAKVLEVPSTHLVEAVEPDDEPVEAQLPGGELAEANTNLCYIVGNVEAGAWRPAIQLSEEEWEAMTCDDRPEFRGGLRFGLRVRGPSMNDHYAPGTILDCVRFIGIDRRPKDGDHVIVYRRGPGDLVEATVKELVEVAGGWELWPRSSHPAHQTPLTLESAPSDDENEEIRVAALVIGSYHKRP